MLAYSARRTWIDVLKIALYNLWVDNQRDSLRFFPIKDIIAFIQLNFEKITQKKKKGKKKLKKKN